MKRDAVVFSLVTSCLLAGCMENRPAESPPYGSPGPIPWVASPPGYSAEDPVHSFSQSPDDGERVSVTEDPTAPCTPFSPAGCRKRKEAYARAMALRTQSSPGVDSRKAEICRILLRNEPDTDPSSCLSDIDNYCKDDSGSPMPLDSCLELTRRNHGVPLATDICYSLHRERPEVDLSNCFSAVREECAEKGLEVDNCHPQLAWAQPESSSTSSDSGSSTSGGSDIADDVLNGIALATGTVIAVGVVVVAVAAMMQPEVIIVILP